MMRRNQRVWLCALGLLAVLALALAGCAGMEGGAAKAAPQTFAGAGKGHLVRAIEPEAQLVKFNCSFKKYKGVKSLVFHVAVKNVSEKPQRFRVNIFLDNGKAVGGLLPRKTKKGLIKPGQVAKFSYPVKGMATKPGSVTLLVKTLKK